MKRDNHVTLWRALKKEGGQVDAIPNSIKLYYYKFSWLPSSLVPQLGFYTTRSQWVMSNGLWTPWSQGLCNCWLIILFSFLTKCLSVNKCPINIWLLDEFTDPCICYKKVTVSFLTKQCLFKANSTFKVQYLCTATSMLSVLYSLSPLTLYMMELRGEGGLINCSDY
jgi:hypothetical protein